MSYLSIRNLTKLENLTEEYKTRPIPSKIIIETVAQDNEVSRELCQLVLHKDLKMLRLGNLPFDKNSLKVFIEELCAHSALEKLEISTQQLLTYIPRLCLSSSLSKSLLKLYIGRLQLTDAELSLFQRGFRHLEALECIHSTNLDLPSNSNIVRLIESIGHMQMFWFYGRDLTVFEIFSLAKVIHQGLNPVERGGMASRRRFGLFDGYPADTFNLGFQAETISADEKLANPKRLQVLHSSCVYLLSVLAKAGHVGRINCGISQVLGRGHEAKYCLFHSEMRLRNIHKYIY